MAYLTENILHHVLFLPREAVSAAYKMVLKGIHDDTMSGAQTHEWYSLQIWPNFG
jgi:hypothetical protein